MIKKTYLSRTQTRAMSTEHPIGDPTGGPAFGEKNDPISAAISIGTMFSVAEAGFAAMTLMEGITFAGAALSLIGNISGNSSLMKIGAIAGIAGGIGAFAESQGLFESGNLSETLGMKSTVSGEMLKGSPVPVVDGAQTPVVDGAANVVDKAAPVQTNAVETPNVNAPNAPTNVNAPGGAATPVNTGPISNPAVDGLNPGTNILGQPNPAMSYAPGYGPNGVSPGLPKTPGVFDSLKAGNLGDAAKAAGSGAMDMLKNNPTGAYVAAQAIGGVADWLSGKTDAEIAALKANTGFADAKAQEVQLAIAKEERRRANMANRYTSVSPQTNMAVNSNAAVQPPGLVAGNMQTRPV